VALEPLAKERRFALTSDFLVGYAPGEPPEILRPRQAKLVKAGSGIIFQVHYPPHGQRSKDQSRLGIVFRQRAAKERVRTRTCRDAERTSNNGWSSRTEKAKRC
jgi:hypothetical protein